MGSRAWKIKGSKTDLYIHIYVCVHTLVHSDLMYVNMYDMLGCRLIGYPLKPPCGVTSTDACSLNYSSAYRYIH